MNELNEIRKRKLEELKADHEQQMQEQAELQQQVSMLEDAVRQRMTKEALQRYGNIKSADPEKAIKIIVLLGQLVQANKIRTIDDENLKRLLVMMASKKKEINIRRK